MIIDEVRIKNYRSLKDLNLRPGLLTVLVGGNDEGKSNVLRALDLFFNQIKPGEHQLLWQRDYCSFAAKKMRKAEEIEISLTFQLPSNYSIDERVVWTKRWRKEGLHLDEIKTESGGALPGKSRGEVFLRSVRYDYVPAIKGPEYFQRLLSGIYEMLDLTVRESISTATTGFTLEIGQHTGNILKELNERLGLKSDIKLPTDLRKLFAELEFHSESRGQAATLSQRGDGVKVRHIPIILRWMAGQANHLAARGRPRVTTIWGFEEPENNLEIKRSFELAREFLETCQDIPIFLTTHSPVFYSAFRSQDDQLVRIHELTYAGETGTSSTMRTALHKTDDLDSAYGLLELLEPYVSRWKSDIAQLRERLKENIDVSIPTLFVEGPTEKLVYEAVAKRFFNDRIDKFQIICSQRNGGGHGWVADSLIAWHYRRPQAPALGLFDNEVAVTCSIDKFKKHVIEHAGGDTLSVFKKVKPLGTALAIRKKHFNVPTALEELYPKEAWDHASEKGWLLRRSGLIGLYGFNRTDVTFDAHMHTELSDAVEQRVALQCVAKEQKIHLATFVASKLSGSNCSWDFDPLKKNLEIVLDHLLPRKS